MQPARMGVSDHWQSATPLDCRHTPRIDAGPRHARGRFVLAAALAAALASGIIYLLQRFVFHDEWGWPSVLILFAARFLGYLALPWIRRFFHGPDGE